MAAFVATAVVTAVVVHVVYSFGDFYSGNRSRPPIRVIPTTMPTTATAPATVSAPGAGSR